MSFQGKRILLKTPINPGTGYGRDGILLAETLQGIPNADVHLEPKYLGLPLPESILPLFAKDRPPHFELAINHEYPGELSFPQTMHAHADKTVAWTMYEFTNFGDDNEMTEKLAERLANFDLVLAYDEVSREALSEYMDDQDRLKILQGGYDADFWRAGEQDEARDWDADTFRFCMNSTMNQRKNPWAAVWAFKNLKEEFGDQFNAELHLKTQSLIFHESMEEWCPGLKIHYANWTPKDMKRFYMKMHCLLAPSWGEGKNLPALEAQTTGMPVAVSAFGGHLQWADPSFTYLMGGPLEEHLPRMKSIRVSADTVAETMWYIYNNRPEAQRKGELASQIIPQMCDWSKVVERLQPMVDAVTQRNYS